MSIYNKKWRAVPCGTGVDCWCAMIVTEDYVEGDYTPENENHIIAGSAALPKLVAEHLVKLHNSFMNFPHVLDEEGKVEQTFIPFVKHDFHVVLDGLKLNHNLHKNACDNLEKDKENWIKDMGGHVYEKMYGSDAIRVKWCNDATAKLETAKEQRHAINVEAINKKYGIKKDK